MKLIYTPLVSFAIFSTAGYGLLGEDEKPLSSHLKPLAAYLGKTYKGEFAGSTPEKPVYDIARWERALNGQAIRITHSLNNGQYGGESIVMWDPKKKSLASWYFTTAGFFTQATMTIEKNKLIAHEKVTGKPLTPFLLNYLAEVTGGESLEANVALLRNNAGLGARIACSYADLLRVSQTA